MTVSTLAEWRKPSIWSGWSERPRGPMGSIWEKINKYKNIMIWDFKTILLLPTWRRHTEKSIYSAGFKGGALRLDPESWNTPREKVINGLVLTQSGCKEIGSKCVCSPLASLCHKGCWTLVSISTLLGCTANSG